MNVAVQMLASEARERLQRRQIEIQQLLAELKHDIADATGSQLDEGTLSNHMADQASDMLTVETDLGRIWELQVEAREIDDALVRIDAGTYGYCADCGEPIDLIRQRVLPLARYCLTCQMRHEQGLSRQRPERWVGFTHVVHD